MWPQWLHRPAVDLTVLAPVKQEDTGRQQRLRVSIRSLLSGDHMSSFHMDPEDTLVALMRAIHQHHGHTPESQRLVIVSPHGHSELIKNKSITMQELKPPSRRKVVLHMGVVAPEPCATCQKQDTQTRVRYCPGCMNVVYCSEACQMQHWQCRKMTCLRKWVV